MEKKRPSIELLPYLLEMSSELTRERFVTYQIPDNRPNAIEGKNIWVAQTHNPKWYSELLRKYPKHRDKRRWKREWHRIGDADSIIVRRDIIQIIERLVFYKGSTSKYADDLIEIAKERFDSGEEIEAFSEFYFSRYHRIPLNKEEVERVERTPVGLWEDLARYKKKYGTLPVWLNYNAEVPF